MNKLIDNLLNDIKNSYEVLFQKCFDFVFAKKVLQIVLIAARSLTLTEINVALNVNEQTSSYVILKQKKPFRLQKTLSSCCDFTISIIQSKVYFIHQTVKKFLFDKLDTERLVERVWQQFLKLKEFYHFLTEICLRFIIFSEVELHRTNLCNALFFENAREMRSSTYCQNHTFLSYNAIYWADHFKDQKSNKNIQITEYILKKSNHHSVIDRFETDHDTILNAASFEDHNSIVQMLLAKGVDVNAQKEKYDNALQAASKRNHDQVMQVLLKKGARQAKVEKIAEDLLFDHYLWRINLW